MATKNELATIDMSGGIPGLSSRATEVVTSSGGGDEFPRDVKIKGARVQFELIEEDGAESVFVESLEGIIPIAITTPRSFFPKEMQDPPAPPFCTSPNGINGFPNENFDWDKYQPGIEPGPTAKCAGCGAAEWGPNKTPPLCKDSFRLVFLDSDGSTLRNIFLRGANFPGTRDWLKWYKDNQKPLCSREMNLTLEGKTRGAVEYAVVQWTAGEDVPEAEWPEYLLIGNHWIDVYESWMPKELREAGVAIAEAEVVESGF